MSKFDNEWIKETLESIGYKLSDFGDHWRTYALYRGGKNTNAVIIFKESGVWSDYGEGSGFQPLATLITKTVGEKDAKPFVEAIKTKTSITNEEDFTNKKAPKYDLEIEESFPANYLDTLVAYYDFYLEKGISRDILKQTKCGYATGSDMYQRMAFPIYNRYGKIHGVAGRYIFWKDGQKKPKWKNLGKTKNWVYPAFQPNFDCIVEETNKAKSVRIVESIGDSLALLQTGSQNHVVSFGLEVKSGVISYLNSLDINEIILSLNNDEENNGQIAMAKQFIKLSKFFDISFLSIEVPEEGDCMDSFEKYGEVKFQKKLRGLECISFLKHNLKKPTQEEKKFIKKYE